MTRDDFINAATPLIRQGFTLAAGLLAAKGMTAAGNSITEWAVSGSLLIASAGWALAEKSKLLASVLDTTPAAAVDDVAAMFEVVKQFRAQGASPQLVAHLAQVAATLAVAETQALSSPSPIPAEAPPAQEVSPPAPAAPGVTDASAAVAGPFGVTPDPSGGPGFTISPAPLASAPQQ